MKTKQQKREERLNKIVLLERLNHEVWKFCNNQQKNILNKLYCNIVADLNKYSEKQIKRTWFLVCDSLNINLNT